MLPPITAITIRYAVSFADYDRLKAILLTSAVNMMIDSTITQSAVIINPSFNYGE